MLPLYPNSKKHLGFPTIRSLGIFLILSFFPAIFLSCAWFTHRPQPEKPAEPLQKEVENPVRYREKEALQFAVAGEANRTMEIKPDSTEQPEPAGYRKKPGQETERKTTKKDSLFAKILEKVNRLRAKKQTAAYHFPEEKSFSSGNAPSLAAAGEKAAPDVPEKAAAAEKPVVAEQHSPQEPLSSYQQIIQTLKGDRETVTIVIGHGKKYWIGSLASRLYPYGSHGYKQTLEWIVTNNGLFRSTADLNMVRMGDQVTFPTKQTIEKILAKSTLEDSVAINQ